MRKVFEKALKITSKVIPWCYTKTQNLGQRYEGTGERKYKSKNENGDPTGVGYAFEDLTKIRLENQGHKVEQVPTKKNGADFFIDGEPCQLKCGYNAQKSGQGFYQKPDGPFRYPGQTAVVPNGHKDGAEEIFHNGEQIGFGRPDSVIESPVSRDEALTYGKRGKPSFKMDLTDTNLRNSSIGLGVIVALIGGSVELKKKWKKRDAKGRFLIGLKWLGIGAASALASYGFESGRRQYLRPCEI